MLSTKRIINTLNICIHATCINAKSLNKHWKQETRVLRTGKAFDGCISTDTHVDIRKIAGRSIIFITSTFLSFNRKKKKENRAQRTSGQFYCSKFP